MHPDPTVTTGARADQKGTRWAGSSVSVRPWPDWYGRLHLAGQHYHAYGVAHKGCCTQTGQARILRCCIGMQERAADIGRWRNARGADGQPLCLQWLTLPSLVGSDRRRDAGGRGPRGPSG